MSKYYSNPTYNPPPGKKGKTGERILVACLWIFLALVILVAGFCWGITLYLTPQRITKIIEEKSSEYLNAEVKVANLSYTLFSTFPWLNFELDSIKLISNSLNDLDTRQKTLLPPDANNLAYIAQLKGSLNLKKLLKGEILVKDIKIINPDVNVVIVNDSMSNFNIIPSHLGKLKIPEFDIESLEVLPPIGLYFTSLQDSLKASLFANSLNLHHLEGLRYDFSLQGKVSASYKDLDMVASTPVALHTIAGLNYPEVNLKLDDLNLSIENIKAHFNTDLTANSKEIKFKYLSGEIIVDDLLQTISRLPACIAEKFKMPESVAGYLPLHLNFSSTDEWNITLDDLKGMTVADIPPFDAKIDIRDATLMYIPPEGKKLNINDIYLEGEGCYRPENPKETFAKIERLRIEGEGIYLDGEGTISDITGELPHLNFNIKFRSDAMETLSYLFPLQGYQLKGDIDGNLAFSGYMNHPKTSGLEKINLKGGLDSEILSLIVDKNKSSFSISDFNAGYDVRLPSFPIKTYQDAVLDIDFIASAFRACSSDGIDLEITAPELKMDLVDTVSGGTRPDGNIRFLSEKIAVNDNLNSFEIDGLNLWATGHLNNSPSPNAPQFSLPQSKDDDLIASRSPHTSQYLQYQGGGMMQTLIAMATLKADVTIADALISTRSYLYPIKLKGLNLSTDLNRFEFSIASAAASSSSLSMAGYIDGVGDFLNSYSPVLLQADADINFSNVDINQLSWGYYGALLRNGNDSVLSLPSKKPLTYADSICVLIPRNLKSNLRLRAQAAEYLGYRFTPLSTDISVSDGVATLKNLTIGTPYCTAVVDWTYSTRSMGNIFMDLDARIKNFSLSSFYKTFTSLTDKSKELVNFTGFIDSKVHVRFLMWPDMFMNSQSLEAKFEISGKDLEFARQGKIERLTHLMLIRGAEPIKLSDILITGGFHDNILQIDPFSISFDDYRLGFSGMNNIKGNIYYHFALEKSPFHLPFGVNLKGTFKHPEVRLGGEHPDPEKAEKIASDLEGEINVNIMSWLKRGWLIFVKEAACYEKELTPDSENIMHKNGKNK